MAHKFCSNVDQSLHELRLDCPAQGRPPNSLTCTCAAMEAIMFAARSL